MMPPTRGPSGHGPRGDRCAVEPFDCRRILRDTTLRHVEYHPTLVSTSDTARALLDDLLSVAPAIVLTPRQTGGHGRQGRTWFASDGALTFSLVLDADALALPPERRSLLAIAAGTAVHDAVAGRVPGDRVRIKWPNDVLVDSRKLCGILTEQRTTERRTGIVIGIGVNVNNSLIDAPDEIRARAVSLHDVLNESLPLTDLLVAILQALETRMAELRQAAPGFFAHVNAIHALNGRQITVAAGDRRWSGLCRGIDSDGCLLVSDDRHEVTEVRAGTVTDWQ